MPKVSVVDKNLSLLFEADFPGAPAWVSVFAYLTMIIQWLQLSSKPEAATLCLRMSLLTSCFRSSLIIRTNNICTDFNPTARTAI